MMNAVVKPYHEMCLNSSELIVPRDTYQRALHPARVARIAKEFDERVANEPKISFRDGHYYAQASMVTEQYAHILDDDRRLNAQRFDDFFYQHQGAEPEMPPQTAQPIPENSAVDADAAAALTKLLANPSMAELIKNLAKNL